MRACVRACVCVRVCVCVCVCVCYVCLGTLVSEYHVHEPDLCCNVAVYASHVLPGQRLPVRSPHASPHDPNAVVSGDFVLNSLMW